MRRYSEKDRFPGVMLMVARDGKVAYWKAFGVRDLESRTPLERNDVFRIFSLTKPVTVTAVLMLMERASSRSTTPPRSTCRCSRSCRWPMVRGERVRRASR